MNSPSPNRTDEGKGGKVESWNAIRIIVTAQHNLTETTGYAFSGVNSYIFLPSSQEKDFTVLFLSGSKKKSSKKLKIIELFLNFESLEKFSWTFGDLCILNQL